MTLPIAYRHSLALRCLLSTILIVATFLTAEMSAQDEIRLDVSAADQVAATYNVSNFRYHIFPAGTSAGKAAMAVHNFGTPTAGHANAVTLSIPSVPAPGFYGEDLVYFGGAKLATTKSNPVYVNMSSCGGVAACWGNPVRFLSDLSNSTFIHLTDQYVGTTANNRYPPSTSVAATVPLFVSNVVGQNDILAIVHTAAKALGAGYGHIYHVFLPPGVDTCFDLTNICYSPDNPPSFVFCAYHGSVTFGDIGHVLLSVEPYQNVPGCQAAPPNPNGILADSTNSVLSHELIEAITDPDPGSGWVAAKSLIVNGAEIGDLCEPLGNSNAQFLDPTLTLNGRKYELQLEYGNNYHACTPAP
ncbi:MAG TPA: hypothetical protein VGK96_19050 [Candidatus Sulfotelmatobacter sp.]